MIGANGIQGDPTCRIFARQGPTGRAHTGRISILARKWGLLLPGAPEPRLTLLRRQGFRSVFQTALRGLSNRSIVVVGNYESGPISAEPCRAKTRPLRPRRSYFAPAETRKVTEFLGGFWWRRRVPPPGPNGLLRRQFISIAGEPAPPI